MTIFHGDRYPHFTSICIIMGSFFILACGPAVPPAKTPLAEETAVTAADATSADMAAQVPVTGAHVIYAFKQKESEGEVEIWVDGAFLRVKQSWKTAEGKGRRWGAEEVLLIFNADEKRLAVVNVPKNRFTTLNEEKMDRARADLARKQPKIGAVDGASPLQSANTPSQPKVVETPKKSHPAGCRVYHRNLPFGLEEETCYQSFDEVGILPAAFNTLLAFGEFVREVETRVPELGSVFAISEAGMFNLGLLMSQYKFGFSLDIDQEANNTGDMESWDRIIRLQKVEPASLLPDDLGLPETAEEAFGLVPWNTPFLDVKDPGAASDTGSD